MAVFAFVFSLLFTAFSPGGAGPAAGTAVTGGHAGPPAAARQHHDRSPMDDVGGMPPT
jgi:hypothetical protein